MGSRAKPLLYDTGLFYRRENTCIDDQHLHTHRAAKTVGGGATGKKIEHHLLGHFARDYADPLTGYAMICGKEQQSRMVYRNLLLLLDQRQL